MSQEQTHSQMKITGETQIICLVRVRMGSICMFRSWMTKERVKSESKPETEKAKKALILHHQTEQKDKSYFALT